MTAIGVHCFRPCSPGSGIGVLMNRCSASRSISIESAALLFVPPVMAARTGSREARRFAQAVPGTPTRPGCRPDWRRDGSFRTEPFARSTMESFTPTPGTAYVSITPSLQAFYAARGMWHNHQPCSALAGMLGPPHAVGWHLWKRAIFRQPRGLGRIDARPDCQRATRPQWSTDRPNTSALS